MSRWAWADQPGQRFDVAGGLLSELRADGGAGGATCLADDLTVPRLVDPRGEPPPGEGYYILLRAEGACESGSYGADSSGVDRGLVAGCP